MQSGLKNRPLEERKASGPVLPDNEQTRLAGRVSAQKHLVFILIYLPAA